MLGPPAAPLAVPAAAAAPSAARAPAAVFAATAIPAVIAVATSSSGATQAAVAAVAVVATPPCVATAPAGAHGPTYPAAAAARMLASPAATGPPIIHPAAGRTTLHKAGLAGPADPLRGSPPEHLPSASV